MEFIPETQDCQLELHTTFIEWRQKSHMIKIIDKEKAFDKIQHPFMIIIFIKLGTKGNFFNMIMAYMKNPQLISFSVLKDKAFPVRSGIRF